MTSSLVEVTGRARVVALTVVVFGIFAITLAPFGNRPSSPVSLCIACGPRGVADGILNLWLFVPLGLALGWSSPRTSAVIALGLVLSTAIELTQTMIPGRDPSLSDILFNTLGTAVGAVLARRPGVWLRQDQRGSLILTLSGLVFVATIMFATVVLLSPVESSSFAASSRDDVALRHSTWAGKVGFDEPAAGDTAALGSRVGQGWALLAYPDAIGRRWGRLLNALWMVALFVPVGFWARRRLLGMAAAAGVLLLVLVPSIAGVAVTSAEEWAGAAAGLVVGAALGVLSNRQRGSTPFYDSSA